MVDLPDSDGKIKEACKDYSKENTVKIQSVLLNLAEVFRKCRENESCRANIDSAQEENEENVNHWLSQIKKYVPKKSGKSFAQQISMLEKSLKQSNEVK